MKISYNWLKEFVDINISPEDLAEKLTMRSFEVENIIYQGEGLDGVVVGEVIEKEKHPDADKLSIVKVKIGGSEVLEIVCGAPNIKTGQKVLVAKLGAEIPCGLKIEKRKVRGVESCGMVCAEDELGLGDDHNAIMVLDSNLEVGMSAQKALNLDDVIFEIDMLPNRAHDCLCHLGVAREVAAITGNSIKYSVLSIKQELKEDFLNIKIDDKNLCRRYSAAVVKDIKIKESPVWLKSKLESCGVRSINNIVDITNFVMLFCGQPMHAFDADKFGAKNKKEIIIRNAKKGEKILALDEKEYKLDENDLVIADENKPIAIAGVMGGLETAVDENTKNIIFEAANFQGTNVRKTSARLKLASESSYRFEREIDPELTSMAISKAVEMAEELAGGKIQGNMFDLYPSPREKKTIKFNFDRVENLLGIVIEKEKVLSILTLLDFEVSVKGEQIEVLVPTFRKDVKKANDIIEEIGRINGYEKIKEVAPEVEMRSVASDQILLLEKDLRTISEGLGFCETYNYSFVSEKDIKGIGLKIEDHLELQNPLSEEHKFMRISLLSHLLENVEKNLKYRDDFALFEIGRVYLKNDNRENAKGFHSPKGTMEPTQALPNEKRIFAGIMADKNIKDTLFYKSKGRVEILLNKLGIGELNFQEITRLECRAERSGVRLEKTSDSNFEQNIIDVSFWHKGRSAEIICKNKTIGKIGEIHPNVSDAFDIETRVLYFEIYIEELVNFYGNIKKYQRINKFPGVELDLSVVFDEDVKWSDVKKVVFNAGGKLVKSVEPFDIYRGKELGNGKKSIAFSIFYQAEDRTLKDEEVGVVQEKVIDELGKLGGEVRK
ncbi:MAG: phenylalanine--tRNA ligase subunit beta [Candidatus Pacebacteria bacterium]|nr:phenylalanine--tRNA ligase subunit beta [Candidatus Paceibacterota bacterium]